MTDLILYTNPMSRGRIARWMLEETGVPYETEYLDYGTTMKSADYLAINPMGKVPCIRYGETVVTEAAAICAYLADVFPDARLAPPPAARGAYYRWLFFAAGPLEQALTNGALGFELPDDPQKRGMAGYCSKDTTIGALETAVANALEGSDYIAGPQFSAADVYVGSHIGWGMQFGTMPARPAFKEYWDRVSNRDAKRRADEIDNAAMPPQEASS